MQESGKYNSLFQSEFNFKRAMVLVPHQDDELNVAANMITVLRQRNIEVFIVYSTNGDWRFSFEKRYKEAVSLGKQAGIDKEHLVFLGYGDAANNDLHDHLFYAHTEPAVSAAGYSYTYGSREVDDYSYSRHGVHRPYTHDSLVEDIKDILLELRPELILCVDWDYHSDHRMLAIAFDEALGTILRSEEEYQPQVWKRFAYSLAYNASPDYYNDYNVRETVNPASSDQEKDEFDLIDTLYYGWNDRIRFPAVQEAMRYPIRRSIISRALLEHRSQFIILHAESIINSDEVYWQRRTDSISYKADVSASSGNTRYLNDFLVINAVDIDSDPPVLGNYLWSPEENDPLKQAKFEWQTGQDISEVVLYGNMTGKGKIHNIHIEMSNGFEFDTGELPEKGRSLRLSFEHQSGIEWVVLRIESADGSDCGLSECEFYSDTSSKSVIPAYCKLLIDNTFAYEYLIGPDVESCDIGVYKFGDAVIGRPQVEKGRAVIENGKILIPLDVDKVRLSLKGRTPDGKKIFDRMTVRRVSQKEIKDWERKRKADRIWLRSILLERKVRAALRVAVHSGIKGIIGKVKDNVTAKG